MNGVDLEMEIEASMRLLKMAAAATRAGTPAHPWRDTVRQYWQEFDRSHAVPREAAPRGSHGTRALTLVWSRPE